jgi:hypothetical protein
MNRELKEWKMEMISDDEINKLAAWFESLTIAQLSFIKSSYDSMLAAQAHEAGQNYVQ